MTEEQITKALLMWLNGKGWKILCFDFPQSGTGYNIHPNEEVRTTKNKGAIIPDIVAIKGTSVVFFENKDRFVLDDFIKTNELRRGSDYTDSIAKLLAGLNYTNIFYGVGLPLTPYNQKKSIQYTDKIDFAVFIDTDGSIITQDQTNLILW
jgi:hypothetical protein